MKNLVLIVVLTFVNLQSSIACTCGPEETISAAVKYYDVIFSGQVISVSYETNQDSIGYLIIGDTSNFNPKWIISPTAVIKIKLDKTYKGQLTTDTITILTPMGGGSCGYDFSIGRKYIVYATIYDELVVYSQVKKRSINNNTFWTNECTRTREWNLTEENEIIKETIPDK